MMLNPHLQNHLFGLGGFALPDDTFIEINRAFGGVPIVPKYRPSIQNAWLLCALKTDVEKTKTASQKRTYEQTRNAASSTHNINQPERPTLRWFKQSFAPNVLTTDISTCKHVLNSKEDGTFLFGGPLRGPCSS